MEPSGQLHYQEQYQIKRKQIMTILIKFVTRWRHAMSVDMYRLNKVGAEFQTIQDVAKKTMIIYF